MAIQRLNTCGHKLKRVGMSAKVHAARAALAHIHSDWVVGIGTGSTVEALIDCLSESSDLPKRFVSSSRRTTEYLKQSGFSVISFNEAGSLDLYIDGADEVSPQGFALKGGGGALTFEKVLATHATRFIGIVDESKCVQCLGESQPVVVEVLPGARSAISRHLVALGGSPEYREHYVTDHGNEILDVYGLTLVDPVAVEMKIKLLSGVVDVGIFADRGFDLVYVGTDHSFHQMDLS